MKLTALLLIANLGCSFVFVRGPSPTGPDECTESQVDPGLDAAWSMLNLLLLGAAIVAAAKPCSADYDTGVPDCQVPHDGRIAVAVIAPLFALSVVSASYGFVKTEKCRRQHEH